MRLAGRVVRDAVPVQRGELLEGCWALRASVRAAAGVRLHVPANGHIDKPLYNVLAIKINNHLE